MITSPKIRGALKSIELDVLIAETESELEYKKRTYLLWKEGLKFIIKLL